MPDARPIVTAEEIEVFLQYKPGPMLKGRMKRMRIRARQVILPGFEEFRFVVHGALNWSPPLQKTVMTEGLFTVSEATTGMRITFDHCIGEQEAAEAALERLRDLHITPDIMRRSIELAKANKVGVTGDRPKKAGRDAGRHQDSGEADNAA